MRRGELAALAIVIVVGFFLLLLPITIVERSLRQGKPGPYGPRDFDAIFNDLDAELPCEYAVDWVVKDIEEYGYTDWVDGVGYLITIDEGLDWPLAIDTFVHEYAHALVGTDRAHDDRWARAYGACYRVAIQP